MKNLSIRTRILAGVVAVNLIGMLVVLVYLHQSYSGGLDVAAQKAVALHVTAWEALNDVAADEYGPATDPTAAQKYVDQMKALTGSDFGLLIAKSSLDEEAYAAAREEAGLPNNWDERENYVLIASSDDAQAESMQLGAEADSLPEIGKVVGVENGACSKTCHGAVSGTGDFWKVRWSKDSNSRAHTVFPALGEDGKTIGVVYGIENVSEQANAARTSVIRTALVIITGLIAATFIIGLLLNSLVFNRLERMIKSMEDISIRVAGGDFDAHFEPDGTNDEIGKFEQFFARFMDLVSGTLKSLVK